MEPQARVTTYNTTTRGLVCTVRVFDDAGTLAELRVLVDIDDDRGLTPEYRIHLAPGQDDEHEAIAIQAVNESGVIERWMESAP